MKEEFRAPLLVARREFRTRVRSRLFTFGTVGLALLIGGYIVFQARVLNHNASTVKVAFLGPAQALATPLQATLQPLKTRLDIRSVADLQTAQDEVRSGTLDGVVSGDATAPVVYVKEQLDATLSSALDSVVRQLAVSKTLAAHGLTPAELSAELAGATVHVETLDPSAAQRTQRRIVGIFVAAILYVSLVLYGQLVAQGVVEEKQNRIVEILLSTVRPWQLLIGKVLGIGVVGFIQLVFVGAVALVAVRSTRVLEIPQVGATAVAGGLLWFLLGFLFYAMAYAAAASLVSRQEEVPSVVTPLTIIVVGTYLAFFWVIANPDSPLAAVISMVPLFAPILMPARMAAGDAAAWQVAIAVVLMVASIAGMNLLAARIYSNSVLRVGRRVTLREALYGNSPQAAGV